MSPEQIPRGPDAPGSRTLVSQEEQDAVSDVVGAILLVGITVAMTVVLALLLMVYQGPEPTPQADLAVSVLPGEGGWGDGDEQVRVRHLGGQALSSETAVRIDVAGTVTQLTGPALGGPFTDGKLSIGETWSTTTTVPATALVNVHVTAEHDGGRSLLAALTVIAGGAP